jgi:hypothetical protein
MRARTPDLVAVEHPFVAVEPRGRTAARRIRARLRFTDRDREFGLTFHKRGQILRVLLCRAVAADVGRGKHRGHDAGGGIEAVFANRLAKDGEHDRVGFHPAKRLRNEQPQPAEIAHFAIDIFGKLAREIVFESIILPDLFDHEILHNVVPHPLLVIEAEIHAELSISGCKNKCLL